jgi:hypothetical protein
MTGSSSTSPRCSTWASSEAGVAYALMKPVGEQVLVIDARSCGPPDSGNGGYVCGLVGAVLGGPVEVTLRRPPPIGRPLLRRATEGGFALFDGEELVAETAPARLELDVPDPVHPGDAREAARSYPGFARHPFPTCFVCGPQREQGDGLRIFPGPVTGRDVVAAPWTPGRTLANGEGLVRPEFVWAALDCPGAFANGFPEIPMVLGRLAVKLIRPVRFGQPFVVVGWSEGSEGRKRFAGTALLGDDGKILAQAKATWIILAPAEPSV